MTNAATTARSSRAATTERSISASPTIFVLVLNSIAQAEAPGSCSSTKSPVSFTWMLSRHTARGHRAREAVEVLGARLEDQIDRDGQSGLERPVRPDLTIGVIGPDFRQD